MCKSGSTGFFLTRLKGSGSTVMNLGTRVNKEPRHWKTAEAPPDASELSQVPAMHPTRGPSP